MKINPAAVDGVIAITNIPLEEDTDIEYTFNNGVWHTYVNGMPFPLLAKIESPVRALISLEGQLKKVFFEFVNGKYRRQHNKYFCETDHLIYDLANYTFLGDSYVSKKANEIKRCIIVDEDRHDYTLGLFSYRTFDDSVFILPDRNTDAALSTDTSVQLTDILKNSVNTDIPCKVFYLSAEAYGYWTETSVVLVAKTNTNIFPRSSVQSVLSVREKYFAVFSNGEVFSRNILRDAIHLGHTGIFKIESEHKWEYWFIECEGRAVRMVTSDRFCLSSRLFYDYYAEGNLIYLVIGNSLYVSSRSFRFDESVLSVSVLLLPIASVVTVKLETRVVLLTCSVSEGVLLCQENGFH